jgi:hypothetical protein
MTDELFESLLFEEEGTTIDFKKEQYRFASASDDEKSELLKDILGFANAWRRAKAYILIGVEEVRGDKSNVVGIPAAEQLDDHSLQQFVNSLVNTPVHFQYRAFSYEGKQVGVFVLDESQQRPVYLKRNYGMLKKEKVYIRRGSSTNPQKPASLDEVARMGAGRPRERAELFVEFAEVDRDDAIGTHLQMECEFCRIPERKDIPKLADPNENPLGIRMDYTRSHNANYYRDLAEYELMTRLCRKVRLTVKNIGEVAANNVRIELVVPARGGLLPTLEMPRKPKKEEMLGDRIPVGIRSALRRDPGEVDIDKNDDRYRIEIDCKDLQPGRQVWSDKFYIGAGQSGDYPLQGQVFADNLPVPQKFTLTVAAEVTHTTLTVQDLRGK